MTTPPKHPKPDEMELEALYDAAWDLRDNGVTSIPIGDSTDKWIYWLHRYEGFVREELEAGEEFKYTKTIRVKD